MPSRRWRRRVIISISAAVAAVVALVAVLHSPWGRERVLASVLGRIAPDGTITATELDYQLLSLRFELTDVAMRSPGRDLPYLTVDRLIVDLPWSVLAGDVALESLVLERPRLQVRIDEDGTSNFVSEGTTIDQPVRLDRLEVRGLEISFEDASRGAGLGAEAIDIEIVQDEPEASSLTIPAPLRLAWAGTETPLRHAGGKLGWNGLDILLQRLEATSPPADVTVDGAVERALGEARLELQATAVVRPDELARLVGREDLEVRGEARVDASVSGPAGSAQIEARVRVPQLTATGVRVESLEVSARGRLGDELSVAIEATADGLAGDTADLRDVRLRARLGEILEIESLTGSIAGGEIDAAGRIALFDPDASSSVHASWSDLRVDELLPPEQARSVGRVAATLTGEAEIGWAGAVPSGLQQVRAEVRSRLTPTGRSGLRPSGSLTATVTDAGWAASVDVTLPEAGSLTGSASAPDLRTDSPVDGRVRVRLPDLSRLGPLLERLRGAPLPGRLAGAASIDADLSGTRAAPRLDGSATVTDVRIDESAAIDATGSFTAGPEGAAIRDAVIDTPGGRLRLDAALDAAGNVSGSLRGEGLQIGPMIAAAPAAWLPPDLPAVDGTARLDLVLSGPAAAPVIEGEASVEELVVGDAPPAEALLRLSAAGDATRVDSFRVAAGDNVLRGSGIVRPQTRLLELVVEARLDDLAGLLGRPELQHVRSLRADAALALDPASGSVSVDLWTLIVDLPDDDVTSVQPAWATWDADGLAVGDLRLRFGDATVTVDGTLRHDGAGEGIRARLSGDLSQFEDPATLALRTLLPDARGPLAGPVALQGEVDATVTVTGTPTLPVLDGELDVRDGRVAVGSAPPVQQLRLSLSTAGESVHIAELSALVAGATVSAEGSVPQALLLPGAAGAAGAGATELASLRVRFADLTESALAPYLPPEQLRDLRLTGSGVLEATATALTLEAARGQLRLDELALQAPGVRIEQARPTRLVLEGGVLRIADWEWTADDGSARARTLLTVTGSVDLGRDVPTVDLAVRGDLRLAALSPFLPAGAMDGRAELELDVSGTLSDPRPEGRVVLSEVAMRYPSPRLVVDDLSGTIRMTGERIVTDGLVGTLNGGDLRVDLDMDVTDPLAPRGTAGITGRSVALETAGARVSSNIDVTVAARGADGLRAFGSITLLEGGYRTRSSLASALRQAMAETTTLAAAPTGEPGLLDRLELDIRVESEIPLVVDAPFAELTADIDVRVTGTAARPGVVGRAEINEGGRVYLSGNTFSVERGVVEFTDPSRIAPSIDMQAGTRINEYAVTIELSGDAFSPTLDASATAENAPDLGQVDALSLIATGRTLREAGGQGSEVLREQAFAFLTGQLSDVTESLGLGTVRLQQAQTRSDNPYIRADATELFPRTTDLATRLTFTRSFGERFALTFSQNLTEAGETSWAGSLDLPWDVDVQGGVFDADTRLLEVRHRLVFGRPPEARNPGARPPTVREVDIAGDLVIAEERLRDGLRLRPGDDFDFIDWQRDQDELRELHWQEGYLEARVRPRREPVGETLEGERPDAVDLRYEIRPGPQTHLRVEGFDPGSSTLERMRTAWTESIATDFLLEDLEEIVRREMLRRGYPRPEIGAAVAGTEPVKEIVVRIEPGPRAGDMQLRFAGNVALDDGQLRERLELADARRAAWHAPGRVVEALEGLYLEHGYLAAEVTVDEPEALPRASRVTVRVEEGPAFRFAEPTFTGNAALTAAQLSAAARWSAGDRYTPTRVEQIVGDVTGRYLEDAYNHTRVVPVSRADIHAGTVALELQIDESPREILRDVVVEGRHRTRRGIVQGAIEARLGEPIGLRAVERIRRRLYGVGAFRHVDVALESMGPAADGAEPMRLRVRLVELPTFEIRYGLQMLDLEVAEDQRETKPGVGALVTHHNFLGLGANLTVLGRARSDEVFGRASLSFPRLLGLPIRSILIAQQARRDILRPVPLEPALRTETVLQLQQSLVLDSPLSTGYSFEIERTLTRLPEQPAFGAPTHVTRLIPFAVYDTRDDLIHPASGLFHSSALELALEALGSDLRFLKYTGNQYAFFSWRDLILASAVRFGTGRSLDPASDALPSSEFFLAGGGTTVRGYPDGSLGSTPFFGSFFPGGDAMLVLNQEVRFPIWGWLQGVGFVDAGRTFTSLGELDIGDFGVSTGAGLRLVSPYGVLRLDYGFPLTDVEGTADDDKGRLHFGIGHIF